MLVNPWTDGPPQDSPLERQHHKVRWLKGKGPWGLTLLGTQLVHAMLHFDAAANRSFPHMGTDCICNETGQGLRYYSYVAAQEAKTRDLLVLQLPEHPTKQLLTLRDSMLRLRGLRIILGRAGSHRNALVNLELNDTVPESSLPEEFEVVPVLAKLWGVELVASDHDVKRGGGL